MGLHTSSLPVLLRLAFGRDPAMMGWSRPGSPLLSNLAGLVRHFRAWRAEVASDLCDREGFPGAHFPAVFGYAAAQLSSC